MRSPNLPGFEHRAASARPKSATRPRRTAAHLRLPFVAPGLAPSMVLSIVKNLPAGVDIAAGVQPDIVEPHRIAIEDEVAFASTETSAASADVIVDGAALPGEFPAPPARVPAGATIASLLNRDQNVGGDAIAIIPACGAASARTFSRRLCRSEDAPLVPISMCRSSRPQAVSDEVRRDREAGVAVTHNAAGIGLRSSRLSERRWRARSYLRRRIRFRPSQCD